MQDTARVLQAIQRQYAAPPLQLTLLGMGFYGKAYLVHIARLPYRVVAKYLPNPLYAAEEAAALRRMHTLCPSLPIPQLYAYDAQEQVLLMQFMPGVNGNEIRRMSAPMRYDLGRHIIECLLTLHAPSPADGCYGEDAGKRYPVWADCYLDRALAMMTNIDRMHTLQGMTHAQFRLFVDALDAIPQLLATPPVKPCLLHGDYNLCNLRIDRTTGRVSGILDPMHSIWGDNELELFQLDENGGKDFALLDIYRDRHGLSDNFARKNALYAAFAETNHYARLNLPADDALRAMFERLSRALS